jgi:hypothetical protein
LYPCFAAVSHDLRYMLDVLLRVAEAFVLYDSGVAYALVFVEDAIGKQVTFPSHLDWPICEVVNLDILACQLLRYLGVLCSGLGQQTQYRHD